MSLLWLDDTDTLMGLVLSCVNESVPALNASSAVAGTGPVDISASALASELAAYDAMIRFYVRSIRVESLHPLDVVYAQTEVCTSKRV